MAHSVPHPELHDLLSRLRSIYDAVSHFQPTNTRPPILDSSLEVDDGDEGHWAQQDYIPGLKKLKEALKLDLDGLEKFLEDPSSGHRPPLSTNAPYLISVWHELIRAPLPVIAVFKTFLFDPSDVSSNARRKKTGIKPPGAKVDIVADGGRTWIRINTMKNSRLLAEFREIDSYLTESSSDSEWDEKRPTLAQAQFDNSILKMGRALLQSARANPIEGTTEIPKVVMRLTRLDPNILEGPQFDPRIGKTAEVLGEMGIEVQFGERPGEELVVQPAQTEPGEPALIIPSLRINLDLSVLIATISDLTHAPLPASVEEANKRFIPPKEYREWKQARKQQLRKGSRHPDQVDSEERPTSEEFTVADLPHNLATYSRALTNQILHEMSRSMIQEIHDKIETRQNAIGGGPTEFWVTTEARDRCLRIVSKIGAVNERRRACALFCLDPSDPTRSLPLDEAEELFWQNSRFERGTIPLFPLHFHSSALPSDSALLEGRTERHLFFKTLAKTCQHILDQETIPHPNSKPVQERFISQPTPFPSDILDATDGGGTEGGSGGSSILSAAFSAEGEIQRATVTKANPRLTAHTVESMLWGAELGWTTLTANRTSVKAILKEVRIAKVIGKLDEDKSGSVTAVGEEAEDRGQRIQEAAIWIVDPRSLAEQMSSQT